MTAPTATATANDFLMSGGGTPSAKFPTPGTVITGPITAISEPQQQRDFTSQQPKFWDDGKPMMQLPVDIATTERDPEITDDDGTRRLYVKGQLQKALRDAIRASGAPGIAVGGHLTVAYTGDAPPKQRGMSGAKQFTVTYTAPPPVAANAFLGTDATAPPAAPPAAPAVPAAPADPGQTAALTAAMQNLPPEVLAALAAQAKPAA